MQIQTLHLFVRYFREISEHISIETLTNHVNLTQVLSRDDNSVICLDNRKAVRATLILIPLLGLQYVLTPFRPPPGSPGEAVYEILAAIFTSFQVS